MKMAVEMLDDGIKKIDLSGRMDIEGTSHVEMKLALASAVEKSFVVVDLSQVDYMASIGIGTLVNTAKFFKAPQRENGVSQSPTQCGAGAHKDWDRCRYPNLL